MLRLLPLILILFLASTAIAQPSVVEETVEPSCSDGACVSKGDLDTLLQLARDHKCRDENPPQIKSDSVTIIVDRQGRIYGTGTGTKPYKVNIEWCNYKIDAESDIELQVAQRVEPTWGFRFRPKATFGFLVADLFRGNKFQETLDGGILLEPFYVQWANVNLYVGVRSLGGGLGMDLSANFGLYGGYALTWGSWRSNPYVSFYFAF